MPRYIISPDEKPTADVKRDGVMGSRRSLRSSSGGRGFPRTLTAVTVAAGVVVAVAVAVQEWAAG